MYFLCVQQSDGRTESVLDYWGNVHDIVNSEDIPGLGVEHVVAHQHRQSSLLRNPSQQRKRGATVVVGRGLHLYVCSQKEKGDRVRDKIRPEIRQGER